MRFKSNFGNKNAVCYSHTSYTHLIWNESTAIQYCYTWVTFKTLLYKQLSAHAGVFLSLQTP